MPGTDIVQNLAILSQLIILLAGGSWLQGKSCWSMWKKLGNTGSIPSIFHESYEIFWQIIWSLCYCVR